MRPVLIRGPALRARPTVTPGVESVKVILLGNRELPARDALHAAVMRREREGINRLMSFDGGFRLPGLTRLGACRAPASFYPRRRGRGRGGPWRPP